MFSLMRGRPSPLHLCCLGSGPAPTPTCKTNIITNLATNTINLPTNTINLATTPTCKTNIITNLPTNTINLATNAINLATNTTNLATNAINMATDSITMGRKHKKTGNKASLLHLIEREKNLHNIFNFWNNIFLKNVPPGPNLSCSSWLLHSNP